MDLRKRKAELEEKFDRTSLREIIGSWGPDVSDLPEVEQGVLDNILPHVSTYFDGGSGKPSQPDPNFPLRNYFLNDRLKVNVLCPEEKKAIEDIAAYAGFNIDNFRAIGTTPLDANEGQVIEAEVEDSHIVKLRIEGYDVGTLQLTFENFTHLREAYLRRSEIAIADPLAALEYIERVFLSGNPMTAIDTGVRVLRERGVDVEFDKVAAPGPIRAYKGKQIEEIEYDMFERVARAAGVSVDDFEVVDEITYHRKDAARLEVRIEGMHITGLKVNSSLTEIPDDIDCLVHLKELSLNWNKISKVGRMILPHLDILDLGDNELTDLSGFRSLFKLRVFYGDRNKISSLEGLPKSVEMVYVGENRVSDLRRLLSGDNIHPRIELDNLKVLYVVDNPIPSNDSSIETLRNKGVDVLCSKRQGEIPNDTKIGEYTIEELISDEGIYHVYEAMDSVKRPCMIKIKSTKMDAEEIIERNGEMLEYFEKLPSIDHPNIMRFIHAGETGSRVLGPYLVMEPIDTSRYKRIDKKKTYSQVEAASIATQLASALAHMHEKGIERSFIGANDILYDEETGMVKLTDSAEGMLLCPMLEEFCEGKGPFTGYDTFPIPFSRAYNFISTGSRKNLTESKKDIFALGLIFYDLLTGFKKRNTVFSLAKSLQAEFTKSEIKELGLSRSLTRILQNMLSGDETETPDAATLVSQLREELGRQEPYSEFHGQQKEFEDLLKFYDQPLEPIAWKINVQLIQQRFFAIKDYVRQHKLSGYFHEELEKVEEGYKARKNTDLTQLQAFIDIHDDRKTALKVGVSEQDVDARLDVFRFWDMTDFLSKYPGDREAARKDGISKEEIYRRRTLYSVVLGAK